MTHMQLNNVKLRRRAMRILRQQYPQLSEAEALQVLQNAVRCKKRSTVSGTQSERR